MKPYVTKIETEAMYAEKSWGTYTVIEVQLGEEISVNDKVEFSLDKSSGHCRNGNI